MIRPDVFPTSGHKFYHCIAPLHFTPLLKLLSCVRQWRREAQFLIQIFPFNADRRRPPEKADQAEG